MKLPRDQPFWTSIILHLVVLLGLFLATIVQAFKPNEDHHVFVMVEPPSTETTNAPAPADLLVPPDVPDLDLPDVPDLVNPAPAPPPPVRATPTEVAPLTPKRITAEEFFRNNPRQQPRPQPVQPHKEFTVPQIDPPKLVIPSRPSPHSPAPDRLTPHQMSALGSYNARLQSRINAAWSKPSGLVGVRLAATVVFDVSASGRVTNARLSPGSGNASFDQSALAAFQRIVSAGPTPTGQGHTFTMTFRMAD